MAEYKDEDTGHLHLEIPNIDQILSFYIYAHSIAQSWQASTTSIIFLERYYGACWVGKKARNFS